MGEFWIVNSKSSAEALKSQIDKDLEKHGYTKYSVYHGVSDKQFGALHVYCQQCADVLNAAGVDIKAMTQVMRDGFSVWHTKDTFKQMVYKPILETVEGKNSTKEQTTKDPSKIELIISKFFAERFGLEAPRWPTKRKDK